MKPVFVKRASDPAGIERLRHEAEVLGSFQHPGVVKLVKTEINDSSAELHVELIEGLTFNNAHFTPDQVVKCMEQLSGALAATHEAGFAHNNLVPENVMVGIVDRLPVIVGFGASTSEKPNSAAMKNDILALGSLLQSKLANALEPSRITLGPEATAFASRRSAALRRLVELAAVEKSSDRLTAQQFHDVISSIDDFSKPLPTEADIRTANKGDRRTSNWSAPRIRFRPNHIAAAAAALLGVTATYAAFAREGEAVAPQVAGTVVCPSVGPADALADVDKDGCPEAVKFGVGQITVDDQVFAIGEDGDQYIVGDWNCNGSPTLTLLRPSNGILYVFDTWPSVGTEVAPRFVASVEGAVSADRKSQATNCDVLSVRKGNGQIIVIEPGVNR